MYREKAIKLLEKLKSFNYKQKPEYLMDIESQKIIDSIVNECKSTVFVNKEQGVRARRYESSFTIEAVMNIVNELLANSSKISRQTMNKILYERGAFAGLDTDVSLYKGINAETARFEAYLSNSYVDEREIPSFGIREDLEHIFQKYAREVILNDSKSENRSLPKLSKVRLFFERTVHRPYTTKKFEQEYKEILKKYSGITNDDTLTQSARYKVNQITSSGFINGILDSIKNGTAIIPLDRKSDEFINLKNQISAEMFEQMDNIPNLNETFKDVNQILKDAETQLTAYTIDFRKMQPEQIEETIKRINAISITDERAKYLGEDGYRNCNVGISGNNIKMIPKQNVASAMKLFAEDIYSFVNTSTDLPDTDYLKKATMLMYRFIRIHPFPDSNGRTSRAILNALTLDRNILVSFTKEQKDEFLRISNSTHQKIGDNYLEYVNEDSKKASEIEEENIDELANFVIEHSTLNTKEQENNIENDVTLSHELQQKENYKGEEK